MIKINNNYSIKPDGNGCTLYFETEKEREKEGKLEKYIVRDNWHFLTVKQCLERYVQLSLEDCEDVKEVLSKMEELSRKIDKLSIH
jgi:hypothetical protein